MGGDRPVFCGNFEYDASVREIERLFDRYGPLDRVDMKTGEAHQLTRQTTSWQPIPFSALTLTCIRGTSTSKRTDEGLPRSTCALRARSNLRHPHDFSAITNQQSNLSFNCCLPDTQE